MTKKPLYKLYEKIQTNNIDEKGNMYFEFALKKNSEFFPDIYTSEDLAQFGDIVTIEELNDFLYHRGLLIENLSLLNETDIGCVNREYEIWEVLYEHETI